MGEVIYNTLRFLPFKETTDWNIKQLSNKFDLISSYPFVRLGKSLRRVKKKMRVEDNKLYSRITIKTNNGGIVVRDTVYGKDIKTKEQYYISGGLLGVSKIDARNGAFGVVPEAANGAIITGNFWVYDIDATIADIKYLVLMFSSKRFVQIWQECSNGSGNRLYLQEDKFLRYKIPFPSLSEQTALVKKYEQTIVEADACEAKATKLEESIEEYLFDILAIEKEENISQTGSTLQCTKLSKLFKWGAEFNLNAIAPKDIFKSNKYKNIPITSYCEINPATVYPKDIDNISFLPMECVSDVYGEIIEAREGKTYSAKGYTRFQENDVLWAKITPCMQNGKCAIAHKLLNGYGYGSTEYHVFRAIAGKCMPEYIHALMRTPYLRKMAQTYFTGSAGQQRVGTDFLEVLTIPAIPISSSSTNDVTQERIANHITSIKSQIKALRQRAESLRSLAKKEFEAAVFGS